MMKLKSHFLKIKIFLIKYKLIPGTFLLLLGYFGFLFLFKIADQSKNTNADINNAVIHASKESGIYKVPFTLKLNITETNHNQSIVYTKDGSEPTPEAEVYTSEGIEIDTSKVIKVRTIPLGKNLSHGKTKSYSYIIGDHKFPIVSLITEPDNLWNKETGIYVSGSSSILNKSATHNFNKKGEEWRRPAEFIYFNEMGEKDIEMHVEIRISGGATRFHPQKSMRVCAKRSFGNKNIRYDFFGEPNNIEHKCIILRNAGNDWDRALFRDILGQSLVTETKIETQRYKPAVVYLNGEYWGIHNIREYYDDNYLNYKYGTNSDSIVIIEPDKNNHGKPVLRDGEEGDEQLFLDVYNNSSNFEELSKLIDVDYYIDYFLINVFVANNDWPDNNIRVWKFKTDTIEHELFQPLDGKWRWLLFDLDTSFGLFKSSNYHANTLENATGEYIKEDKWPNAIIRTLLSNEEFKNKFINRYADLLNSAFSTEIVLNKIEELEALYEPEIPMHTQKWGGQKDKGGKPAFENIEVWRNNLRVLKTFARFRPEFARYHVVEKFNLSGTSVVKLNTLNKNAGSIRINSINTDQHIKKNELVYFNDIPIELEAKPKLGWKFVGWGNDTIENKKRITITLKEDLSLTPTFERNIIGKILNLVDF